MGQKFGALEDFSPQEFPRHVENTFVTVAGCFAIGFTLECTKIRDDLDERMRVTKIMLIMYGCMHA